MRLGYRTRLAFGCALALASVLAGTRSTAASTPAPSQPLTVGINVRAPRAADDSTAGYSVGNVWNCIPCSYQQYTAVDVSAGAAVWVPNVVGEAPVIDQVNASFVGAYGSVLLDSAYVGNAFTIERASDSATKAIGFVTQNVPGLGPIKVADYQAAMAFCAHTTCGYSILNDQSGGGNDATQPALANQCPVNFNSIHGIWALGCQNNLLAGGANYKMTLPVGVAVNTNSFSYLIFGRLGSGATIPIELGTSGANVSMYLQPAASGITQGYVEANINGGIAPSTTRMFANPGVTGINSNSTNITFVSNNESSTGAARSSESVAGGFLGTSNIFGTGLNAHFEALAILIGPGLSQSQLSTAVQYGELLTGSVPQVDAEVAYLAMDSIGAGVGPTNGMTRVVAGYPLFSRSALVVDYGVPGTTCLSWAGATFSTYYKGYSRNIAVDNCGVNDIDANETATAIEGYLSTIWTNQRTAGFTVIAETILPNSAFTSPQQTVWNAVNAWIRTNYLIAGAQGLVDLQSNPTIGPLSAASNTTLYFGGLHPTALGYEIIGALEAPNINQFLGLPSTPLLNTAAAVP